MSSSSLSSSSSSFSSSSSSSFSSSSSSSWTAARSDIFKLWTMQLVTLAFRYVKAASWSRRANFLLTFISIFSAVFTIPGYGCGLVTGNVCSALQWVGIIVGVISGTANGIGFAYDPATRAIQFDNVAKSLLKLSREISLELARHPSQRTNCDDFAREIVNRYDALIDSVRLPFYIDGEQQLANLSLLQSYNLKASVSDENNVTRRRHDSSSSDDGGGDDRGGSSSNSNSSHGDEDESGGGGDLIPLNDDDRRVMMKIEAELARIAAFDMHDVEQAAHNN